MTARRAVGALVLVGLAVGAPVALVVLQPSPGPLSAAHAMLDGRVGCVSCHAPGGLQRGCLECHREVAVQLDEGRGLHHHLAQQGETRCASCHSEHRGAAFRPLNDSSWPERDPRAFAHEHLTEFALGAGRHADLRDTCEACHAPALVAARPHPDHSRLLTPRTFLGLDPDCRRCHSDPHEERAGADCAACHGQASWSETTFQHADWYPLLDRHAGLACARCHRPTPATTLGEAAGDACQDCHTDPHAGRARQAPFAGAGGCDRCHTPAGFAGPRVTFGAGDHCPQRFPLVGRHAEASCAGCHPGERPARARRGDPLPATLAGARPEACVACHRDVHAAGEGEAPRLEGAEQCARCHEPAGWRPARLTPAEHARTGFALLGPHAGLECARCHTGSGGGGGRALAPSVARDAAPARCDACHTSPHRAALAPACVTCHATEHARWDHAQVTPAQHARAEFPLAPPHAEVACARCHPPGGDYAARHPRVAASDCAACHRDPHAGQFVRAGTPRPCTECHAETHFTPHGFDLEDHAAAYPLTGAHRALACDACHPRGERRDARGPDREPVTCRLFRDRPTSCRGCHGDPHDFARAGAAAPGLARGPARSRDECTACHTEDAASWRVPSFDHERTRFPLVGQHAEAECGACHRPDPDGRRRFRALDRACAACHEDPHAGQFAAGRTPDAARCDRCHRPDRRGWGTPDLDHDQTAFPLDGKHAGLSCAACHRPAKLRDGRAVVRYRPLGATCKDCHGSSSKR